MRRQRDIDIDGQGTSNRVSREGLATADIPIGRIEPLQLPGPTMGNPRRPRRTIDGVAGLSRGCSLLSKYWLIQRGEQNECTEKPSHIPQLLPWFVGSGSLCLCPFWGQRQTGTRQHVGRDSTLSMLPGHPSTATVLLPVAAIRHECRQSRCGVAPV